MINRRNVAAAEVMMVLFFALAFIGCSSGGGGSEGNPDPPPAPTQQVLPATYDFGTVTVGNAPAPLEVKINNNGTANLNVSNIALSDLTNFTLNLAGGTNPCNATNPTIAAGGTCTFEVGFQPGSIAAFAATVRISSNDAASPFSLSLSGASEAVSTMTVRINQIDPACTPATATAYVSVTDQGGYPVAGLTDLDFTIDEGGLPLTITGFSFPLDVYTSVSIVAVMDYSASIIETPDSVSDMEEGLLAFVDDLGASDEMEIIKFDTDLQVVQTFTSDHATLKSAISSPFEGGGNTKLYDTVYQAVVDAGATATDRRAVIVITDGSDSDAEGNPLSVKTLPEVIDLAIAEGVPIFTIGIGENINTAVLSQMADDTGGQFFKAIISDNLRTIYQQLSSLLFKNQYKVEFDRPPAGTGNITITVAPSAPGGILPGEDTRQVNACPL